ncbi:hypothetical protein [Paenibacillus macerans]|uniref:hypothetical protein n=1 Tax=Paenibacillus macerans TaxID=44252 RepID=UPI001BD15CC7|nr:hypothetical protein [Paenibacillus macerans]
MDNVKAKTVIRQLISLLPIDVHQRLLFDHYTKKLTTMKAIMLFINAQLKQWSSYGEMEIALRAEPKLQQLPCSWSTSGTAPKRQKQTGKCSGFSASTCTVHGDPFEPNWIGNPVEVVRGDVRGQVPKRYRCAQWLG